MSAFWFKIIHNSIMIIIVQIVVHFIDKNILNKYNENVVGAYVFIN